MKIWSSEDSEGMGVEERLTTRMRQQCVLVCRNAGVSVRAYLNFCVSDMLREKS